MNHASKIPHRPRAGRCVLAAAVLVLGLTTAGHLAGDELILKDGRHLKGRILQETATKVKFEKEDRTRDYYSTHEIAEIRRAPDDSSRLVDIHAAVGELLDRQDAMLELLSEMARRLEQEKTPGGGGSGATPPAGPGGAAADPSPGADRAPRPGPYEIRRILGEPDRILHDCVRGTAAAGAFPFTSAKWVYPLGAGGVGPSETRALFFVNDHLVGSIIETAGGRVIPDADLPHILAENRGR